MSLCFHDQLLQTAHAYLNAHNDRDISSIRALCDQKSVHRAGPLVVKSPDRTNGEHVNFNEEVFKVLHTYHATITDVVANEVRKKVVLYVDARATADADEYENEYVITLAMTEDGERVVGQYDFIDSQRMTEWIGRMGEFAREMWEKK